LAGIIAAFEQGQLGSEIPVFIAARPMTNGGFVLAKLAMTAVSSLLTWCVVGVAVLLCLILGGQAAAIGHTLWFKPLDSALMLLSAFLILVLATWRNLVAGLWIGLSGRPTLMRAAGEYVRYAAYAGMAILVVRAVERPEFRATLLRWVPWILSACLVVKLSSSAAAFYFALRQKAVTRNDVRWFTLGWFACSLVVAIIARDLCVRMGAPQWSVWAALAGFYFIPLAELSLAPLALSRNRHQ
jgi:uncharacterized membrane protein YecN with MAPEG domain